MSNRWEALKTVAADSDTTNIQKGLQGLRRVQTWQLVVLLIITAVVSATFLRLNSIGMAQRREAVLTADSDASSNAASANGATQASGAGSTTSSLEASADSDQNVITQRLYDLQRYVSSHMNTDLGRGVYLEASYNRDLQNWQKNQYGDANPNGNIYLKAQQVCAPQFQYYSYAYLQCTTNELAKYPSASDPATETSKPRQEAYIHAFASPVWSPDFAGWSVVVGGVLGLWITARLVSAMALQLMLKRRYKQF